MAFQALISEVIQDPDNEIVVRVIYTDNVSQKVLKEYRFISFDLNSFKQTVQDQISEFESSGNTKIDLPIGPFDPTITPPAPTPKGIYGDNLRLFGEMTRAIAATVKTAQDADYVALQKTLQTTFDPSFIDLF